MNLNPNNIWDYYYRGDAALEWWVAPYDGNSTLEQANPQWPPYL